MQHGIERIGARRGLEEEVVLELQRTERTAVRENNDRNGDVPQNSVHVLALAAVEARRCHGENSENAQRPEERQRHRQNRNRVIGEKCPHVSVTGRATEEGEDLICQLGHENDPDPVLYGVNHVERRHRTTFTSCVIEDQYFEAVDKEVDGAQSNHRIVDEGAHGTSTRRRVDDLTRQRGPTFAQSGRSIKSMHSMQNGLDSSQDSHEGQW